MAIGLQDFPPIIRSSLTPLLSEPQAVVLEEGKGIGQSGYEVVKANQSVA